MTQGRQKDELKDITLLGNQNNTYEFDYRPEVIISIKVVIILLSLIVQNSHHYALLRVNQILRQFISRISLISRWWNLNH